MCGISKTGVNRDHNLLAAPTLSPRPLQRSLQPKRQPRSSPRWWTPRSPFPFPQQQAHPSSCIQTPIHDHIPTPKYKCHSHLPTSAHLHPRWHPILLPPALGTWVRGDHGIGIGMGGISQRSEARAGPRPPSGILSWPVGGLCQQQVAASMHARLQTWAIITSPKSPQISGLDAWAVWLLLRSPSLHQGPL